ncbi:cell division cycle-associated protein 7-like isoform X1 [Vigna unguiculata]|uniref:cell division cycle-associated protein 7-like isoform X1 n=1 Tax=Vigna unguiculata TaxID=3917 RepID=UPI001016BA6D|nr:cell division cycle-associated protein 7-like isoform X1 [Vigna unguiculata]XP_027922364.1 cell division cycle-associated protein 7-like isoform X1 [Vigna unguiculata]XP_027922365.1 cell division cycle-associated protein 7-like isoform X1 [Vigna unguiculata]XP_027922366.1 cell division cycle-associated protein 7-like isoform X1 [Vigna unguiculata]XP_027922367.1 cell division cycle-associated protein 7-like isoform X1 [Vigna unguiculata]XP_027922368.1 cell division cycle-associated protein 7
MCCSFWSFVECLESWCENMQDETASSSEEKWFVYGPEKKEEVDKYIHSSLLLQMDGRLNFEDAVASSPKRTGKSCHQCRQKKENFAATCKNFKKGKRCPIKFCNKCLLTRYGENAEVVGQVADWTCPKCRGCCNCSICQKRRGEQPTGPLYKNAKECGYMSVAEMLAVKKASKALNPSEATFEEELEVCNNGGDNVGAMCQGEVQRFPTIEEELLLPLAWN